MDGDLIIGLGALYLALFAISASVTRRLRRQSQLNARLWLAAEGTAERSSGSDARTAVPVTAWR